MPTTAARYGLWCSSRYRVVEKERNMPREHWGGFGRHNKLYRICVAKNGREAEESIAESHCPYDVFPVLGGGMQAETEQKSEGDA